MVGIQEAINKAKGKTHIKGWVYRIRKSKKLIFMVIRDANNIIQCVIEKEKSAKMWKDAEKLLVESSVEIDGKISKDERAPNGFEIQVEKLNVVDFAEVFPITKDFSTEFLADNRHLWLRSRKMTSSLKVRSTVMFALHQYMRKNSYIEVEAPSLSGTTSEGGSDTFEVKYFNKKAYLTQSWQFYAENFISAFEKVYAMAPSFRAENSKTPWHVTEFWHFEIEAAWMDINQLMEEAENCVVDTIKAVVKENQVELKELGVDINNLKKIKTPFKRITYKKAIEVLQKKNHKIKYGEDFGAQEERSLAKYYGNSFVFVTNYPLSILKFYHGEDLKNPGTGTNFNLLAPGVGEMVDGSQREWHIEKIQKRLKKAKIDLGASDWYLDSRRYGSTPHSGFGMGVERFVAWICNLETIKDAIPFPRTPSRYTP